MTVKDINEIIKIVCPNDEDYEKPIISPKYLRQELEQLALEQEHRHLDQEPTTQNDLGVDIEDAVVRLNALKLLIGYDKDSEIVKATQKSLDMAIKALEQEPTDKNFTKADVDAIVKAINAHWELIIDEIRAEIANYQKEAVYSDDVVMTKRMVLAIIDKYKAESEAT